MKVKEVYTCTQGLTMGEQSRINIESRERNQTARWAVLYQISRTDKVGK